MTVRRRTSPSADGAASGVVVEVLRATRVIVDPVCPPVVVLSSFIT
jgi:hypothetical protein